MNAGALCFGAVIYVIYLQPDGSEQGPSITVKRLLSSRTMQTGSALGPGHRASLEPYCRSSRHRLYPSPQ